MKPGLSSRVFERRREVRKPSAAESLFDLAAIRREIAAVYSDESSEIVRRQSVIGLLRQKLDAAHKSIRQSFEYQHKGLVCAANLARTEDQLIKAVHEYVVTYVHTEKTAASRRLVIAAVGGYGRETLAPGSDIDLLFLIAKADDPASERIIEQILYVLWDLRQKIGHSTRSIDECLLQAQKDMTVRTALLESRLILGSRTLFDTLRKHFEQKIVKGTAWEFVAAKLAERDARLNKSGRSRYLVEPNVKEGKGGLRDLNTLFWIAKYVYQVRAASDLVATGLFSQREYRLFCRCEEFLWRVRCTLHYLTGRPEERLSFDLQRQAADQLGYSSREGMANVERFMRHYFLIAKDVGDLTAIVCAALEEKEAKPVAQLDRFNEEESHNLERVISGGFAIEINRITVSSPDIFERNPVNMIKLYWIADRNGLAIHPDATRLVTLSLKRIDSALRENFEANRLFLDILTSRNRPEIILRLMNESGVLGRFIPDFGRIVALMQFNMYHHYTVDEHLLRAVGHLADIENHRVRNDHILIGQVMASIANRRPLYVALFLHDIAKGRPADHSQAGIGVARRLCPRLGLSDSETESVAWLIENHLVMSDTAQRRDLNDRRTIATFAQKVQSLERLKMLFLLTIADIRAVGPGVLNNWKSELLRTLFWETEVVLAGGHSMADRKRRVNAAQDELRHALPLWTTLDFEAYSPRLPPAYWLKVDLPHKILHAKLLNQSEVETLGPLIHTATDASRGVTELTVIAPDHPRLLSIIAGACAASAANIVDAQIFTSTDGVALDTIFVSRAFDLDEDELRRADRIALGIERALCGEIRLQDIVAAKTGSRKERSRSAFHVHPDVTIDNNLSLIFSVVEVSGLDRPGLLYELTTILSRLDLNIGSAHIVTFGEKMVDVFYITDFAGAKITSATRQSVIKRQLLKAFAASDAAQMEELHLAPVLS